MQEKKWRLKSEQDAGVCADSTILGSEVGSVNGVSAA